MELLKEQFMKGEAITALDRSLDPSATLAQVNSSVKIQVWFTLIAFYLCS
jgi:hypothetical protein